MDLIVSGKSGKGRGASAVTGNSVDRWGVKRAENHKLNRRSSARRRLVAAHKGLKLRARFGVKFLERKAHPALAPRRLFQCRHARRNLEGLGAARMHHRAGDVASIGCRFDVRTKILPLLKSRPAKV